MKVQNTTVNCCHYCLELAVFFKGFLVSIKSGKCITYLLVRSQKCFENVTIAACKLHGFVRLTEIFENAHCSFY